MKILGFGKKEDNIEDDIENIFREKRKDSDNMVQRNLKKPDDEIIEMLTNDDYIDPDDLSYCDYEDIVNTIEEHGWDLISSVGSYPITHFDSNIIHTIPCKRNSYENILELICPPGNIVAICGFNQEDIDKEEFFNSPNLYTRPHFFTLRLADDNNSEIPSTTIIGISRITRNGNIEKLYEEFYGDVSPTMDGTLKKKEERYYLAETIVLQSGEKLVFRAYWPFTDIMKIELLMMADLFIKE